MRTTGPWGAPLAAIESPAELVVVGENVGRGEASFNVASNAANDLMLGHLGTTNFLFGDGHGKAMRPIQTGTPYNMWIISNPTRAAAPRGTGTQGLMDYLELCQQTISR